MSMTGWLWFTEESQVVGRNSTSLAASDVALVLFRETVPDIMAKWINFKTFFISCLKSCPILASFIFTCWLSYLLLLEFQ